MTYIIVNFQNDLATYQSTTTSILLSEQSSYISIYIFFYKKIFPQIRSDTQNGCENVVCTSIYQEFYGKSKNRMQPYTCIYTYAETSMRGVF